MHLIPSTREDDERPTCMATTTTPGLWKLAIDNTRVNKQREKYHTIKKKKPLKFRTFTYTDCVCPEIWPNSFVQVQTTKTVRDLTK